jgi:hypothetical protein
MLESEICFMTATELAARIRAGELSASEVRTRIWTGSCIRSRW